MNWALLRNSVLVAWSVTLATAILGGMAALWLRGTSATLKRAFLLAAIVNLALPPFLVTNSWLDLLGETGAWHRWLPVSLYSFPATVAILALLLWPIPCLLALGSLETLEPSQLECDSALQGWPLLRWLVWPAMAPALIQAALITFILAFNNFAVPAVLQTKVYPAEIWVSFNTTFDYARTLQLGWPSALILLLLLVSRKWARVTWPRLAGSAAPGLFRRQLGNTWNACGASVAFAAVVLGVIVPLGDLVLRRRTWLELPGALAAGQNAVVTSLEVAALAASVCLAIAFVGARWRWGIVWWLFFLLPGVMVGMGLVYAFNRAWSAAFYESIGIVVFALGLRYLALSWTALGQALQGTDPRLADFAQMNRATPWQVLRFVHWPQLAPTAKVLWFLTYLFCLWDVETLILVMPPGGETLAVRIFNLLHYGHNTQVNALCILLLGVALLPALVSIGWHLVSTVSSPRHQRLGLAGLAAILTLPLVGCGRSHPGEVAIQSKFFERVQIVGSRGTALGQFNKPRSVAVDRQDNLYVVDMTGRVQKFTSNGVYLTSWQFPQTEKGKPKGMICDASGNLLVVEPHYTRVNHFTPEGKLVSQWGTAGTNNGQLCLPRAIAVNSHGEIIVCEYTAVDRVQVFSAGGKEWVRTIGHAGLKPGEFNRPEGLAVDSQDRIYVADSCNHRIQVFSAEGKLLNSYGHAGRSAGELSYPYDIRLDSSGLQFVCEFGNSRLQVFDQKGRSLEVLGGPGADPGQFSNPWSIALDSAGNLYVADSQNHRVQKLVRKHPLPSVSMMSPRGDAASKEVRN